MRLRALCYVRISLRRQRFLDLGELLLSVNRVVNPQQNDKQHPESDHQQRETNDRLQCRRGYALILRDDNRPAKIAEMWFQTNAGKADDGDPQRGRW